MKIGIITSKRVTLKSAKSGVFGIPIPQCQTGVIMFNFLYFAVYLQKYLKYKCSFSVAMHKRNC